MIAHDMSSLHLKIEGIFGKLSMSYPSLSNSITKENSKNIILHMRT